MSSEAPAHPLSPHQSTPAELQKRIAAESTGHPFLLYRDGEGAQRIVELGQPTIHVTIGRSPECDICLGWDAEVSRLHAEVECVREHWVIEDDGLCATGRSSAAAGCRAGGG